LRDAEASATFNSGTECDNPTFVSTSIEILVAQMTVAELAQRSGRSVSQLVELAFGSSAASAATVKRGPGRPPGAATKKGKRGKGKAKAAPAAPKAEAKAAAPKAAAKAAPATKKADVDTRAAAGRAKYDETVLAAIRGAKSKVKAADLRSKLGGTPLQIRAALHRLIEDGKIKAHGQARGTTYTGA
jgi:hypothetical protein